MFYQAYVFFQNVTFLLEDLKKTAKPIIAKPEHKMCVWSTFLVLRRAFVSFVSSIQSVNQSIDRSIDRCSTGQICFSISKSCSVSAQRPLTDAALTKNELQCVVLFSKI